MQPGARGFELAALALCIACQRSPTSDRAQRASPSALAELLAPSRSAPFSCDASSCTQPYPRLPDTAEWRCAEREGVVWCAGGEPAAGVVPGGADASYLCGQRVGSARGETVCVDPAPDYPLGSATAYTCSFAQERGMTRVCKPTQTAPRRAWPAGAVPTCWLDRDCRSGQCDRGACRCQQDQECPAGSCRAGVCAEARR